MKNTTNIKKRVRQKRWIVTTPEFSYTEYISWEGGPSYSVRDVVDIMARTRRDAVTCGVKYMLTKPYFRGDGFTYVHDQRSDGACPFTGVRAYRPMELHKLDGGI